MLNEDTVFDAVRRGCTDLQEASPQEICEYFSTLNAAAFAGHVNNIKGIVFEQEVVEALNDSGLTAGLFAQTNHPDTDIFVLDESEAIIDFQLKATDSIQYISSTLEDNPDIPIIATSEVAAHFSNDVVLDSGLSNEELTDLVTDTLATGVADVTSDYIADSVGDSLADAVSEVISPFPIFPSPLWLFGLPF